MTKYEKNHEEKYEDKYEENMRDYVCRCGGNDKDFENILTNIMKNQDVNILRLGGCGGNDKYFENILTNITKNQDENMRD